MDKKRQKIQLVLGSGGARGLAHIGIIEALERDGYEIVEVIGCSMGAIVGGVYCAGYLDVYKDWLLTLTRTQVFQLMDFSFNNMGFLKGEKILGKMREITGDQKIENLKTPFIAVATDMVSRQEVHFRKGDLYSALRASMSIPGVFTPVRHAGQVLVDGAVLNPLPLNLVNKQSDTLVVAVNLNGRPIQPDRNKVFAGIEKGDWDAVESSSVKSDDSLQFPKSWVQKLLHPVSSFKNVHHEVVHRFSLIELMTNSFYFTQDRLVELTILAYPPDVVFEIPRNACHVFDFHKTKEMVDLGLKIYDESKGKLE